MEACSSATRMPPNHSLEPSQGASRPTWPARMSKLARYWSWAGQAAPRPAFGAGSSGPLGALRSRPEG
jgi:hypothetical protein